MAENVSRAEHAPTSSALNVPNALTLVRLILVPVFIWLMLQDGETARWWALAVFCFAAATDYWDGRIARARGIVTDFGRVVDPIADKALTLGAFVMLSVAGPVPWWFTILVAVRELGITALRAALLRRDIVVSASSGGKLKTLLQMLFIVLFLTPWPAILGGEPPALVGWGFWTVGAAALVVTLWSGAVYVYEGVKLWRSSGAESQS